MKRLPDWEERLSDVLAASFERPFRWGEHDCALFVCSAIEAMTGVNLSLGLRGSYDTKIGAYAALRARGCAHVGELAELMAREHGIPEIPPTFAAPGDVILTKGAHALINGSARVVRHNDFSLGICLGEKAAVPVLGPVGLGHDEMENVLRAWRI